MEKDNRLHRKVILLGDTTVGKSSIINRRINNTFNQNIPNTIGTAFFKQSYRRDNVYLDMSIWDTCGQEQFMAISTVYYRDAHVIFLVVDCTSSESLEMAKTYLEEIENNADPKVSVFLCLNKIDLLGGREFEGEKVGYADVFIDSIHQNTMNIAEQHCEFYEGNFRQLVEVINRNQENAIRKSANQENI